MAKTLPNGIHSTRELLDAQAHVWNHTLAFINSMSLKCAIQLGIPDLIHKHAKPMTLSELTDSLPIDNSKSVYIERLMGILVHSNFFVKVKNEGYCLTPSSLLLLRDTPSNMTQLVLFLTDPIMMDPWNHASRWFEREADPTPFATAHGETFWDFIERGGVQGRMLGQLFNEAMANDTWLVMSVIVRDCRHVFEGMKSMVDVGGGTGTMAKAMADAFPGLKCIVLDLPRVVASSEGGCDVSFVAGDMFESIPHADIVFMKWVLHDWSDEDCVRIMKNCKEVIPSREKGGKVIIVDMVVGVERGYEKPEHDSTGLETQLFFDMGMMAIVAGKERSEKDWAKLFHDAGFSSYEIAPVFGLRSLIQVFP